MNELFLKIINMSISASWLVLAVLLLRFVLKKAPKWVNVLLWGIVAVRLAFPFSIESALSLIPSAKSAVPKIKDFITNAPGEVKKMVEGVVRQKMAEALALGVPNCPSVDAMKNTEASTENSASNVDSSSASGTTST